MTFAFPELATSFLLTFARVGVLIMLLPGIGEQIIPSTLRLALALMLTLILLPITRTLLPATTTPAATVGVLLGEITAGLVLGLSTRMILAALQTAGLIAAQELGLAYALTVDPTQGGQQAATIANFLNLLGLTLIFATDLHHLAIGAIRNSYAVLPPVGVPDVGDASRLAVDAVGRGFSLAMQIAAPFIAFGILFNLGLGILSRLMPQMQVFFIGLPLAILIGVAILLAALGGIMGLFVERLGSFLVEVGGR